MIDITETQDSPRECGPVAVDGNGSDRQYPPGWLRSMAEREESLPEGVFHLLTADSDVASTEGGYVAVCGAVLVAWGLPPACYLDDVGPTRDPWYCPACVREAARWSAEADDPHLAPR